MAETRDQNSRPGSNSSDAATKKENPRKAIREARLAKLKVIDGPPPTIKVYPANESMRSSLRHSTGTRFREKMDQSVEWPNDSFTHRRLREGSISLEPQSGSGEAPKPDQTKNAREQAEACKPKETRSKEERPAPAPMPAPAQARSQQPTPTTPTQTPPQPPPTAA